MMEKIAEVLQESVETMVAFAQGLFYGLMFVFLIMTTPVWIIPYLIWRNIKEAKDNEQR